MMIALVVLMGTTKVNAYNCSTPTDDNFLGACVTGPCRAGCKATISKSSWGSYTTYNNVSGYSGSISYTCPWAADPIPYPGYVGPNSLNTDYCYAIGTVSVSANIPSASWSIVGPSSPSGSGTSGSYSSVPEGSYTITWGAVSGYVTPSNDTVVLSVPNESKSFSGTYTPVPSVNLYFSYFQSFKKMLGIAG